MAEPEWLEWKAFSALLLTACSHGCRRCRCGSAHGAAARAATSACTALNALSLLVPRRIQSLGLPAQPSPLRRPSGGAVFAGTASALPIAGLGFILLTSDAHPPSLRTGGTQTSLSNSTKINRPAPQPHSGTGAAAGPHRPHYTITRPPQHTCGTTQATPTPLARATGIAQGTRTHTHTETQIQSLHESPGPIELIYAAGPAFILKAHPLF